MRRWLLIAGALVVVASAALIAWGVHLQGGLASLRVPTTTSTETFVATPSLIERGRYLARIGNCAACHNATGRSDFAGGRAFATPYGTLYSSNLTPDATTGLGDWSRAEFGHAMRHGVSRRGALAPVFPFANFALLDDADLDALFAFLQSLPAQESRPPEARLAFPAYLPGALLGWRMLYFRPMPALPPMADAELERGRYLVEGLGHCSMCHSPDGERGSLNTSLHLTGASAGGLGWYAPALDAAQLQRFDTGSLADYLRTGNSEHGAAYGPMAEVVYAGLQYLDVADARAMARYLLARDPQQIASSRRKGPDRLRFGPGRALYAEHCAGCHGEHGEGDGLRYPPLQNSVAVRAEDPANAVRMLLNGGIAPSTQGNPRPYGMPPFAHRFTPTQSADVINFIRAEWGGHARAVQAHDVTASAGMEGR